MRFRVRLVFIEHVLFFFLLLLSLLLIIIFVLFWFFRTDITAKGEGNVICAEWVNVKPEISGMVKTMMVNEGDKINRGDLLFILDDREKKLEVVENLQKIAEIKMNILSIEQNINIRKDNILNIIDEAKASLNEAEADFRIMEKGPKPEEKIIAERSIQLALQHVEKTSLDFNRMEKAFSLKLVSRQELDHSSHQKKSAITELELARDRLALLMNKYDKDQIHAGQARVQRQRAVLSKALSRKKETVIIEQDLSAAQKALTTEEKRQEFLIKNLELTQIISSISGIIMTYDTKRLEGIAVSKGEVVLKIGGSDEYLIECNVSEKDFPLVKTGQKARVSIKSFPKGEYKLFSAIVATTGADSKAGGPSTFGIEEKLTELTGGLQTLRENYYPVTLKLEKPYHMNVFGNQYEIKPGFSAQVEIIVEQDRILTLLFKRILRIKGKLTPDNIYL